MRWLAAFFVVFLLACAGRVAQQHSLQGQLAERGDLLVSVLPLALETLPDSIRSRPLLIDTAAVRRATMADPARVVQQLESTLGRSVTVASVQEATSRLRSGGFEIVGDGLHLSVGTLRVAGDTARLTLTTRTTRRRDGASALGLTTQEMVFVRKASAWALVRRRTVESL